MMVKKIVAAGLTVAMAGSLSHASLIAYEGFDYSPGVAILGQGGADLGWSGAWRNVTAANATVAADSLSHPAAGAGTGQHLALQGQWGIAVRDFNQRFGQDGTTLWFSLILTGAEDLAGFQLADGVDNGDGVIKLRPNANAWQVLVGGGSATTAAAADQPTLLLGRVDYLAGDDTVSLWFNPASLADESLLGTPDVQASAGSLAFDRIRLNAGSVGTGVSVFDEIRVGSSLQSMSQVPEPASLALLAAGGLAVLRRRRALLMF